MRGTSPGDMLYETAACPASGCCVGAVVCTCALSAPFALPLAVLAGVVFLLIVILSSRRAVGPVRPWSASWLSAGAVCFLSVHAGLFTVQQGHQTIKLL